MANPELELISNIVKTADFTKVRKESITPEFFRTEEGGVVFKWLWDEFHHPSHRGEVPNMDRLLRKYPDFDYCPSRNSIAALIDELKETNLQIEMERVTGEMQGLMDDREDPRLILQAYLPQLRDLNLKSGENSGLQMRDAYGLLKQEYETTKDADGVTGIPFPWEILNRATGGMQSEQFIVIYGRPKNFKTFVAIYISVWAYLANRRVYIFSKEMRREDLARRAASMIAEVDYAKVKSAELSDADYDSYFDVLQSLSAWEDDFEDRHDTRQPGLIFDSDKGRREASSVEDIMVRAEKFEPDLVVVDGFYLMRDGRTKSRTVDWKNIGHISQDLKGMAQYLECPVLGTTQANRANAKAPTDNLDDLSFADNIGQDADLAMRCFKGPDPTQRNTYAIALTFPGVREADLKPFLINAKPSSDFTVLQSSVNMADFLKSKDAQEGAAKNDESKRAKDEDGKVAGHQRLRPGGKKGKKAPSRVRASRAGTTKKRGIRG